MIEVDAPRIKQKMLGVRMRSARTQVGLNIQEAAQQLGIAPATLNNYELGREEISLPELEAMARIFDVPVSYFWSNGPIKEPNRHYQAANAIPIRRKIIGILIQQKRDEAGHSREKVAEVLGCSVDEMAGYELGERAISFSQLERLASFLDVPLGHFLEEPQLAAAREPGPAPTNGQPQPPTFPPGQLSRQGSPGEPAPLPADLAWLAELPEDIKAFLSDPTSLLYLRLSMRLHNLSAETLRTLAEGILDITY